MANTTHNPITTKWSGTLGGFRYSIVRGKQVISERPSHVRNPQTKAQVENRAKFKLASQFSALWNNILDANAAHKIGDTVLSRSKATKIAHAMAQFNNNEARVQLRNFVAGWNQAMNQDSSNFTLTFTSATQQISGAQGTKVAYKVVAFNAQGFVIGSTTQLVELGTAAENIVLPAVLETPERYDILAFEIVDNDDEIFGNLTNTVGAEYEAVVSNLYTLLVSERGVGNTVIHSLVGETTLA
jgi:hypothetical protein